MTIEEAQEEADLLNLQKMFGYPCSRSIKDDYYSLYTKSGRATANLFILPFIYNGLIPTPSSVLN